MRIIETQKVVTIKTTLELETDNAFETTRQLQKKFPKCVMIQPILIDHGKATFKLTYPDGAYTELDIERIING